MRTLGKNVLQIQVEVFHAIAATEEHGEYGPYNLAVLIAYQRTANSQMGVDYRGQNTVKYVQNEKYSTKRVIFSDFCCTFAMSLMILLVLKRSTKVSKNSDMTKS